MKFARHYKQLHQLGKILPARFPVLPPSDTDREQPFFIVSAGRSGSTLMASLLGQHSEISMPTEQFVLAQSIVKFNLFNWMQWEDCSALICTEFIRSKGSQADLRTSSPHYVKLAGSFVRPLDVDDRDDPMVRGLVQLAHGLDVSVIASWVVSTHQLQRLRAIGCDHVQGFHVARPVRADDFDPTAIVPRVRD